ncbi:MAG: phosphate ABC transporter permease PstA [Proteobacteria bacterium]|nr:phosphate ABC transporter permease PstA [Pseudomonadota bacterium]MBU1736823.1 phosphate ABC transporter permease PstA [Pseudomonadota bacterium]
MKSKFWRQGEPYVWGTGLSLSLIILLMFVMLYAVIGKGVAAFWPADLVECRLGSGLKVIGEITGTETIHGSEQKRFQFKIGNRDLYGLDFRWIDERDMGPITYPLEVYVLERQEYGDFYGYLKFLDQRLLKVSPAKKSGNILADAIEAVSPLRKNVSELNDRIVELNYEVERTGILLKKMEHSGLGESERAQELKLEVEYLKDNFTDIVETLNEKQAELSSYKAVFTDAGGREKEISINDIVRFYQPNKMTALEKLLYYGQRLRELFFDEPRESNTEGGLFPAIFGTIMLIFLMSIFSFPLGVVGGIYLREYARDGFFVRTVRIAVNNLAGIPSIVYGIFGLGFFVYGIGSQIDLFFFPERLPIPTFGTGGIFWASLTLGLLTVPVVIVATEEALGAIPPGIREGSQALAATKFQTLTMLLLPMASPGILTGFILAMARAAGEVAPLMITGVVKLAPALPLDSHFPFLHLDRKFMHLGFHIYDIGFQSPNVEAAKPMVYVTTLLLILIVVLMTSLAIYLRNKMRARYSVVDV